MNRKQTNNYEIAKEKVNEKKYDEAIKLLKDEIKNKGSDANISYGLLGYISFKQKAKINAMNYFKNKDFLKAISHPDFIEYAICWTTVYYNCNYFSFFPTIIRGIQNAKNSVDSTGKRYDKDHELIMFIKGLIEWKIENNLQDSLDLLKRCGFNQANKFIPLIEEKIRKSMEDSQSISISIQQNITMSIKFDPKKKEDQSKIQDLENENLKLESELASKYNDTGNLQESIKIYESAVHKKYNIYDSYLNIAKIKLRLKDLNGALSTYSEIIKYLSINVNENRKKIADIYIDMAKGCMKLDRNFNLKDKVEYFLNEAKKILPSYSEINNAFGNYYLYIQDYRRAIDAFEIYKAASDMGENENEIMSLLDYNIYWAENKLDLTR